MGTPRRGTARRPRLAGSRSGPAGDGLVGVRGHSAPAVVSRGVGVASYAGVLAHVLRHSE
jgi:hypothetical protein